MTNLDLTKLKVDSDTLSLWVSNYDQFLSKWTWDGELGSTTLGNIAISDQGLVGGRFVTDDPLTSYTPPTTGTSEGQLLVIRGCLELYLQTGDKLWLKRANTLVNALLKYFYPTPVIPSEPDYSWVPHWLVNVTAPFKSREYFLNGQAHFEQGIATVNYDQVFKIFSVRAIDATLAYDWAPDAPIKTGKNYEIDHTNVSYGQSKAVIYLKDTTFTGDALVAYSSETGPVIQKGEMVEAYPVWRPLQEGEIAAAIDSLPWALDVFQLFYKATGSTKWQNAVNSTVASIEAAYKVDNTDYFLKPRGANEEVLSNGVTSYSTRSPAATYQNTTDGLISITYPESDGEELFGSWVGDHLVFNNTHYMQMKLGTDIPTKINFLIDETGTYDPQRRWTSALFTSGQGTVPEQLEIFNLKPSDFFRASAIWWGHGYTTDGDGNASVSAHSAISATEKIADINGKKGLYKQIDFTRGDEGGWYGWAQYVIVGSFTNLPFDISYRTQNAIDFVIVDSKGQQWRYSLPATNGAFVTKTLNVQNFTGTNGAQSSDLQAGAYNTMFFDAIDNKASLDLEYMGQKEIMPESAGITNISIGYNLKPALSLAIGYVISMPRRNPLPYAPYIAPFDMHFLKGNLSEESHSGSVDHTGGSLSDLRGAPYTGYQAPWIFQETSAFNTDEKIGNATALETNLQFLSDSQDYYANNTGLRGFFAPVFWWDYRDDANGHPINSFSMTGPWGNVWGGFQYRTFSDVARVLTNDPENAQARKIFLDFVTGLNEIWLDSDDINTFPTDFNDRVLPAHSQNDPHMVAVLIRALSMGINANLTAQQQQLIYNLINRGLSYLNRMVIPISEDPFSISQVEGTFSPNPYINEWYEYWGGDILSSLAHILPLDFVMTQDPHYYVYFESNRLSNEKGMQLNNNSEYFGLQSASPSLITITGPCSVNPSWRIIQNGNVLYEDAFHLTLTSDQILIVSSYPENQYARVYNADGSFADVSQLQDFTKTNFVQVPAGQSTALFSVDKDTGVNLTFKEERLIV